MLIRVLILYIQCHDVIHDMLQIQSYIKSRTP